MRRPCIYFKPAATSTNCIEYQSSSCWDEMPARTSAMRFASGFSLRNSTMFPLSIHSEIIANLFSAIVTPSNGKTFGCRRCFQATASRQNFYQCIHTEESNGMNEETLTLRTSSRLVAYTRTTLTATECLSYTLFDTLEEPPT
jgi:hypothetical protein